MYSEHSFVRVHTQAFIMNVVYLEFIVYYLQADKKQNMMRMGTLQTVVTLMISDQLPFISSCSCPVSFLHGFTNEGTGTDQRRLTTHHAPILTC